MRYDPQPRFYVVIYEHVGDGMSPARQLIGPMLRNKAERINKSIQPYLQEQQYSAVVREPKGP